MAHDVSVQKAVRTYYVFDRLSLEMSADKAGVSFGTARRWKAKAEKDGDNWDKARDVQVIAGGGIENIAQGLLAGFLIKYRALMTELEENTEMSTEDKVKSMGALADSFAKVTASSKKILPSVSEQATAIRTVQIIVEKLKQRNPALLADFMAITGELETEFEREFKK
ncbi:DNA-binding protein [Pasteurellaceae bacterium 15-036681]|nr:DNA-binding protein [Pasteurellaceae bacterium 15-036681]